MSLTRVYALKSESRKILVRDLPEGKVAVAIIPDRMMRRVRQMLRGLLAESSNDPESIGLRRGQLVAQGHAAPERIQSTPNEAYQDAYIATLLKQEDCMAVILERETGGPATGQCAVAAVAAKGASSSDQVDFGVLTPEGKFIGLSNNANDRYRVVRGCMRPAEIADMTGAPMFQDIPIDSLQEITGERIRVGSREITMGEAGDIALIEAAVLACNPPEME
jgi:hypothetical protein